MDYAEKIEAIVGRENVRRDEIERLCYSRDLSVHEGIPDVIVFAKDSGEVSKIQHKVERTHLSLSEKDMSGRTSSMGKGMMSVEFFSDAISRMV